MSELEHLRAADADRARVVEVLRQETIEGRLRADEFDSRLDQTLNARTYGELAVIVADLPVPATPVKRTRLTRRVWTRVAGSAAVLAASATVAVLAIGSSSHSAGPAIPLSHVLPGSRVVLGGAPRVVHQLARSGDRLPLAHLPPARRGG